MSRGLFLLVLLPALARPEDAPHPACALVKACGLDVVVPACTAEKSRAVKGVVYDGTRCEEPRDLLAHGVKPTEGIGVFVYPFLGGRYRVVYELLGEAPISGARFDYLASELPLAARLASRFSGTKYVVRYSDANPNRFHASRAGKLTGDAELLFHDEEGKRRTYYGWGSSKFGPWKLRGSAYVDVRVRQTAQGIAYDVRVRTAPVNAMVNTLMGLGVFRGYVVGQVEDTMRDLVGAATALSPGKLEQVLSDPGFSPEEREKVKALAALP